MSGTPKVRIDEETYAMYFRADTTREEREELSAVARQAFYAGMRRATSLNAVRARRKKASTDQ